jgi:hypothetical protein
MVCFVVVPVESLLSNSDSSFDRCGVLWIEHCIREVFVEVIHSRYHSGDVGSIAREEQGGVLEDLLKVGTGFVNY